MASEASLQKRIINELRRRRAWWLKVKGGREYAGIPDLLIAYLGRFVAIEVKNPNKTGQVTKLQRYYLDQINERGAIALAVNDFETVVRLLDAIAADPGAPSADLLAAAAG